MNDDWDQFTPIEGNSSDILVFLIFLFILAIVMGGGVLLLFIFL